MNDEEKKANEANDPIHNLQYIYQYKIQYTIPNTVTKKESIPHKSSLHNRMKKFNHLPQLLGEGGLLMFPFGFPHHNGLANVCILSHCTTLSPKA